jgi:hypothetical protein
MININNNKIYKITSKDPGFVLEDGIIISHRAAIEIDSRCPDNYSTIVQYCIAKGWIKPVAYITEREKIFIGLTQFK